MMKKLVLTIAICFSSFGFASSCRAQQDERINVMSPDVRAELVFFFKEGTNWEEILEFNRTVIGVPARNGTGHSSLPGMMTTVKIEINGYEGEAINFQPNATEEEKAFVKKRVKESPLIYRIYENVVPDEITDLPDAENTEEGKSNNDPAAKPTRKPNKVVITRDS